MPSSTSVSTRRLRKESRAVLVFIEEQRGRNSSFTLTENVIKDMIEITKRKKGSLLTTIRRLMLRGLLKGGENNGIFNLTFPDSQIDIISNAIKGIFPNEAPETTKRSLSARVRIIEEVDKLLDHRIQAATAFLQKLKEMRRRNKDQLKDLDRFLSAKNL